MGVFLRHGDRLIPMREQVYQAEAVLERLLAESPALLAGDDDSGTRRLLLLGRTDDQAGPDYVFLDQEGIPTLVEVTRSADPEASRELVGQMVDYAANVIAYQDPAALRAMLEARCRVEGRDRKSTRLNSSHTVISYAVFCLKKKKTHHQEARFDCRDATNWQNPRTQYDI